MEKHMALILIILLLCCVPGIALAEGGTEQPEPAPSASAVEVFRAVEDFAGMYEEDEIKEIPVITPDPFVQEVPAKPVEPVSEENEIDINAL